MSTRLDRRSQPAVGRPDTRDELRSHKSDQITATVCEKTAIKTQQHASTEHLDVYSDNSQVDSELDSASDCDSFDRADHVLVGERPIRPTEVKRDAIEDPTERSIRSSGPLPGSTAQQSMLPAQDSLSVRRRLAQPTVEAIPRKSNNEFAGVVCASAEHHQTLLPTHIDASTDSSEDESIGSNAEVVAVPPPLTKDQIRAVYSRLLDMGKTREEAIEILRTLITERGIADSK